MNAGSEYLQYKKDVTPPRRRLPSGACDTHFHVFEEASVYPFATPRSYTPTPAPLNAYRAMAKAAGLDRAVLVHPSVYGRDHRSFEDTLALCQGWMRGVAVVYPDTREEDIERWHALGARGSRCNAVFAGGAALVDLPLVADRVRSLGWHIQLLIDVEEDATALARVADLGLPVVVDHFGHVSAQRALTGRGFANMLALVREGRVWVKLSGAYRVSAQRRDHADVAPVAAALLRANPARVLWGSDWPHPAIAAPMPDDGQLVDLLFDWCTDFELQQVLVENPSNLYWAD